MVQDWRKGIFPDFMPPRVASQLSGFESDGFHRLVSSESHCLRETSLLLGSLKEALHKEWNELDADEDIFESQCCVWFTVH